jgi:RHS repeat-associated protein
VSVTTYTTVNGMILSQAKGGVVSHFVPDPLGSVVMVRDTSGNTVYEAEYDPYGNVQSETGTNPSSLGYVGTLGYIKDSATSMYVRARYLLNNLGRWLTKDPLWPREPGFVYAKGRPIQSSDRSGLRPGFVDTLPVIGCFALMVDSKKKACSVFRKDGGRGCVADCMKSCWGQLDLHRLNCLEAWCDWGSLTILPNTGKCCDPDILGHTVPGTGESCTIGICMNSCTDPWYNSPRERETTVIHEALHCCETGSEVGTNTEEKSECTAKCIIRCRS